MTSNIKYAVSSTATMTIVLSYAVWGTGCSATTGEFDEVETVGIGEEGEGCFSMDDEGTVECFQTEAEADAHLVPAALATASASPAAQRARTVSCSSGYVCIYKGDIWDDSPNHPMVYKFYNYGTYNVANLIGDYTVKNCQTGGAGVKGFTGYDGTGSVAWDLDVNNCDTGLWTSLTSTNSVQLYE